MRVLTSDVAPATGWDTVTLMAELLADVLEAELVRVPVQWATGRSARAVSLLRRAIDLSEDQPNETSLDHLGDALWLAGKNEDAVRAWKQAQGQAAVELERHRGESPESPQAKRLEQHVASLKAKLDAVTNGQRPLVATTWADK